MEFGPEMKLPGAMQTFGWTTAELDLPGLYRRAGHTIAGRGIGYYQQNWRFTFEYITPNEVGISVRGSDDYQVEIIKEKKVIGAFCDCPYLLRDENFDQAGEAVCKHIVAAVMVLRDFIEQNRHAAWHEGLDQVLRATNGSTKPKQPGFLFFSLQERRGSWELVAYTVAGKTFPASARTDPDEAAQIVAEQGLKLRPANLSFNGFAVLNYTNVSHTQAELVRVLRFSGANYGRYYGDSALEFGAIFNLLKDGPLFLGTEPNPLAQRLEVCTTQARIHFELRQRTEAGTEFSAQAVAGDRIFPFTEPELRRVSEEPIWLLSGLTLFGLDEPVEVFEAVRKHHSILIPPEAEEEFFATRLQPIAEQFPVQGDGIIWEDLTGQSPVPRLYLSDGKGSLRGELRYAYGEFELPRGVETPINSVKRNAETGALVRVQRDPEAESGWLKILSSATHGLKLDKQTGHLLLRSATNPIDFLLHRVPRLAAAGCEVYGEEALKLARINRNRPTISFGVTSGIDWFDLEAVVRFGELEIGLKEVRRAVRKKEQFVKLTDGSIGEIPVEWLERYRHLFALGEETPEGLRLNHHHVTLLDQLLADDERAQTDDEFKQRAARLRDFAGIKPSKPPKHFIGELRPYQKAGFDWLYFLHDYNFGVCLADDMGTGKTIVTLAFLQSLKERRLGKQPSLLVVPRSLIFNWEREAAKFTPKLRVLNHATPGRTDQAADFAKADLVLTTYGLLLRDLELLRTCEFNYLILDEAQAIKNPLAETAKAVRLLRGAHRLTLTGTPVENNTLELWSQFAFLNPGLLGSAEYFREEFSTRIERNGDEAAATFLRKMVYPFILRRTKDQVAPELPPRTERQLICEMEPAQRKFYNDKRDYYRALLLKLIEDEGINNARIRVLEGLLRLRQICNHPLLVDKSFRGPSAKFELLLETLGTLQAEGRKALVFSQFVGMLTLVSAELKKRKIPFSYLDGKTQDRQQRVDEFQNDPSIPFFLISLKAGGVGLNLTAADYVIHIDPWWNPAVEMQATDRTHRIGQDKPVFIYKLIVRDSVEEKVVQLQERKRALVTKLVSTEGSFFKSLSADDVAGLFS